VSFLLSKSSVYSHPLSELSSKKLLITTINAHSYNVAQIDDDFAEALEKSDVLLPDGVSITIALRVLKGLRIKKIAGADLFFFEMNRINKQGGTCFFLGSSENTLNKIYDRVKLEFPEIKVSGFSPPYKSEFSTQDNEEMISIVNSHKPDVLFIGMTAPKQEKWAYKHFNYLHAGHICCIGAVFDFYSGTVRRAPVWVIKIGFEWLFRFIREPIRMWRRYLIGNSIFIWSIFKEKFGLTKIR
jgi:N-acetylglucosaminyldiphosphoundecaprenol N-acetyl-beta-D-mannosaminyltransferase